jgi:glycosyltransferase involved in cell wall biosynthesis
MNGETVTSPLGVASAAGVTSSTGAASPRPRVCFVSLNGFGEISRTPTGHSGGSERQMAMMARWFAAQGYAASMVTWDLGAPDGATYEGVRVFHACRPHEGLRGVRFIHPRWTSLNAAMRRAEADVYYYHLGDMRLGQVALWCRRQGRGLVYSVASDADCEPERLRERSWRERAMIAQTQRQADLLRTHFGVRATPLPMPCGFESPPEALLRARRPDAPLHVAWVGRFVELKRLEWLLELAERHPDVQFEVAGGSNQASAYADGLTARAARLPNVRLHGRVGRDGMAEIYRRCDLLCCTSEFEGFPNTFLEAWSQGTPLLTTFDPDGIVAARGLGWAAQTVDELSAALLEAQRDADGWLRRSRAGVEYFRTNHALDPAMRRVEAVVNEVYAARG